MDESTSKDAGNLEFWAVLELFGHSKIAGFVRQVTLGGDVLLRVDVPEVTFKRQIGYGVDAATEEKKIASFTKFYSPKSVFAMTPTTEQTCRRIMGNLQVEPINPFDARVEVPALPAPSSLDPDDDDEEGRIRRR